MSSGSEEYVWASTLVHSLDLDVAEIDWMDSGALNSECDFKEMFQEAMIRFNCYSRLTSAKITSTFGGDLLIKSTSNRWFLPPVKNLKT